MSRQNRRHSASSFSFEIEALERRALLTTNGLYGQYFDDADLTVLRMSRNDISIDFDWGAASPYGNGVLGADTFSARWTGQVVPEFSQDYTFTVAADDGVRLWVGGELLIDRWTRADDFPGDADRDGIVNLNDFNRLAVSFNSPTGMNWEDGDFNYDGAVNLLDFNLLANNFNKTRPPGPVVNSGTIALTANEPVDIKLEYFDYTGPASVDLRWTSAGLPEQTIPKSRLLNSVPTNTFTNPIIGNGADPWVVKWNNQYVYTYSDGGAVWIAKAPTLQGIGNAPAVKVWDPPPGQGYSQNVWAPELHFLDGKWYVYVAADNGNNANHRMYVLERSLADPVGAFGFKGKIAATTDRWAIDGTVLETGGNRYFVWSGWPGFTDGQQNLYIAPMSNPWTISGDRQLLAQPSLPWEQHGLPINEGPEVLSRNGKVFIIYSGSGYWTNEYALGQLTLTGTNPAFGSAWTKRSTPVFAQANGVTGVGHASFTSSPDGSEDWLVYHAHNVPTNWQGIRDVRTQPFTWNADGTPNFGQPVPTGASLSEPSGTPTFFAALSVAPDTRLGTRSTISFSSKDEDDVLAALLAA